MPIPVDETLDNMKQLVFEEVTQMLGKYNIVSSNPVALLQLLIELNYKHQPLSITSHDQAQELWNEIDRVPDAAPFVMELTQRFYLYYQGNSAHTTKLLEMFSNAAAAMQPFGGDGSVGTSGIDPEALKDMPNSTYHSILKANRWLIPLILISLQNVIPSGGALSAAGLEMPTGKGETKE